MRCRLRKQSEQSNVPHDTIGRSMKVSCREAPNPHSRDLAVPNKVHTTNDTQYASQVIVAMLSVQYVLGNFKWQSWKVLTVSSFASTLKVKVAECDQNCSRTLSPFSLILTFFLLAHLISSTLFTLFSISSMPSQSFLALGAISLLALQTLGVTATPRMEKRHHYQHSCDTAETTTVTVTATSAGNAPVPTKTSTASPTQPTQPTQPGGGDVPAGATAITIDFSQAKGQSAEAFVSANGKSPVSLPLKSKLHHEKAQESTKSKHY